MLSKTRHFLIQFRSFSNSVGIVGVPFSKGQRKPGTDEGPDVLRDGGLLHDFKQFLPHLDVKDYGDVNYTQRRLDSIKYVNNWPDITVCNEAISNKVQQIVSDNRICLTLGGDHSIAVGTVHGHAKALKNQQIALLWVDAHADLNTPEESQSGNAHGMPLSLILTEMKKSWPSTPGLEWHELTTPARNLAFIGLRSVDPFEKHIIRKYNIAAYGADDVHKYGIDAVIKMALQSIDPDSNRSIHVSFDIDSLDALESPSTGTPVRGGLLLREGIAIMEVIHQTGRMNALDLVEVNPKLGNERDVSKTVEAAKQIILAAFGHERSKLGVADKRFLRQL